MGWPAPPRSACSSYCVARRSVLESAVADEEFECVQELPGPLPVAGL